MGRAHLADYAKASLTTDARKYEDCVVTDTPVVVPVVAKA